MDKLYQVQQRMALPGAKPPRAQRHSLNPSKPTAAHSNSVTARLSQPPASATQVDQNFSRTGREPIRRRKPVPMPRTFLERGIDVPVDFEMAAYGPKKGMQPVNQMQGFAQHYSSPSRPKSMLEGASQLNGYRVSHKYSLDVS